MTKQEIIAVAKALNLPVIGGALGETKGLGAYVESERVTENGWETKYFGIATPFKGKTDNDIIDRVTITKKAFFLIVKLWPIRINKIVDSFWQIYIAEGGLKSRCLKDHEFCPAVREIIKAGKKIFKREEEIDLVYCSGMILQESPSYRVRIQDMAGEINKENFIKAPFKEMLKLRKVFMAREKSEKRKMTMLWNLIILGIIFKRKQVINLIKELDLEKVRLDEIDWYYCLRRPSYDFGGKSFETRLAEAEKADKEKGNIILGI